MGRCRESRRGAPELNLQVFALNAAVGRNPTWLRRLVAAAAAGCRSHEHVRTVRMSWTNTLS